MLVARPAILILEYKTTGLPFRINARQNMKFTFALGYALLLILSSESLLGQDSWKIDSTQIVFHISNAGFEVAGTISGVAGEIKFSKNKLDQSYFRATAKSETIKTGNRLRDKHLKKADYFDVEKYPTIRVETNNIIPSKDGFTAHAVITIKGVTKNIDIPFGFKQTKDGAEFKGSFSLNRLDFGVGGKSFILSDTVRIDIWIGASLVNN